MAKPFRFRHAHAMAGAFVLATAMLLVTGLWMTGHSQRWFQPVRNLTILLPEEGSLGLRPGAEVFLMGTSVGSVQDIAPGEDGRMRAQVTVRRDYSQFIRVDSTAVIRKTFGIAGDSFLEISRGTGEPLPPGQAEIPSQADRAPTEMLGELLVELRDEGVPTLKEARATMEEYRRVAAEYRDPDGPLQRTLARADRLTAAVERGEGVAGKLLADAETVRQVEAAIAKVNASLDEADAVLKQTRAAAQSVARLAESGDARTSELPALIRQTRDALRESQEMLKDVRRTSAKLPDTVGELDRTLRALLALATQTQESMRQFQRLVEGAQRHWLVRGHVDPEPPAGGTRIRPEDVAGRR